MKRDTGVERVTEVVGTEKALACGLPRSMRKNKTQKVLLVRLKEQGTPQVYIIFQKGCDMLSNITILNFKQFHISRTPCSNIKLGYECNAINNHSILKLFYHYENVQVNTNPAI